MTKTIDKVLEKSKPLLETINEPRKRADKLIDYLDNELKIIGDFDIVNETIKGTIEMVEANKKVKLIEDINFAIEILKSYKSTNEFNLDVVPLNLSKGFQSIQSIVKEIIENK